jgi:predicted N-acyltransferase
MFSTMPGRMRWSGRAGGIIRNCKWPCRFRRCPGSRLLAREGLPASVLAAGLEQLAEELDCSSVHATFCTGAEWTALGEAGWLQRLGTQFHWENNGYQSFDDFLAALSSRKRKAIKRERRDAQEGLNFKALTGAALTKEIWNAFYKFYTLDRGPQMGRGISHAGILSTAG